MISGSEFDPKNGEDSSSDPASEDGAEDRLVTCEGMDGRVGNKNGIVKGDEVEGLSDCSWSMYRGNVEEIGDVCGVFRRTYEDIGVSASFSERKDGRSGET